MGQDVHIVAMSGSLRQGSYNTALLNAAKEMLPDGMTMEVVSFASLPVYNGDIDLPIATERPKEVTQFRDVLARADGFLFVSPEYNHSLPGGLKNAIDWASRGQDSPLLNKAVAVMGATTSLWGTARMQLAFLPVFLFLNMTAVNKPEVLVAQAQNKFDQDGRLTDETARGLVRKKLEGLKATILQLRSGTAG